MLHYKRNGFTMIELVFVIVVLGILAAIAIPKFAATRDDAQIAKGRSDVAAIRAAIVSERQGRLMKGQSSYITELDHGSSTLFDDNDTDAANGTLLQYGIAAGTGNGKWAKTGTNAYTYTILSTEVAFTYDPATGAFNCTGTHCDKLTN